MRTAFPLTAVLLTAGAALAAPVADEPSPEILARRAAVIKPSADEVRWRQIPWLTDLGRAQELARKEGRPIFLWATGDDPLERC
jgi:hypothetical protein